MTITKELRRSAIKRMKEGRKKYYIMVGPFCAECLTKRKKLDIPSKR